MLNNCIPRDTTISQGKGMSIPANGAAVQSIQKLWVSGHLVILTQMSQAEVTSPRWEFLVINEERQLGVGEWGFKGNEELTSAILFYTAF